MGPVAVTAVLWITMLLAPGDAADFSECKKALGMQSGSVPDSAITASSVFDAQVDPHHARLHKEIKGGAWCPKKMVDHVSYEWLQIDFQGHYKVITQVETQGRFGNGQGQEFAEYFYVEYQRDDHGKWIRFTNRKGDSLFRGNRNTYTAEPRDIDPPIIAKRIRIIPYSENLRTVCMRVELSGCEWKDGVVAYSMQQGDRRGVDVDLYDFTYDGQIQDRFLTGGLGQLTDGVTGVTNFRLDPSDIGYKGYEWVGWKNDTRSRPPVELEFSFDTVRNFSRIIIHTNNMFSKDVRVFRRAEVYFSIGGRLYQGEPVVYNYLQDNVMDYARSVLISIPNLVGRYLRILLFFEARWIMISEVTFDSKIAVGNFTPESLWTTTASVAAVGSGLEPRTKSDKYGVDPANAHSDSSSGIKSSDDTGIEEGPKKSQGVDYQLMGIIVGALGALFLLLTTVVLLVILRSRKKKSGSNSQLKSLTSEHVTLDLNDIRALANGKLSNGNMYNSVATASDAESEKDEPGNYKNLDPSETATLQTRKLPDLPKTPESTDTNTSREYAVPDLTKATMLVSRPMNIHPDFNPPLYGAPPPEVPPLPHPGSLYAASNVVDVPSIQGMSGSSVYAAPPNLELLWKDELAVIEFPRERLKFVEKLGEGQFGEVHLCEATNIADMLGDDFLVNRTGSRSMLVAVKMLRAGANQKAREDFHKELKLMSRLRDPNIVRVMGVCTTDEPLCVIVEYMKFGDLHQFMQNYSPESTGSRKRRQKTLSYGCLVYMAHQIASGMKYLESLNMVHRDLATRNCLVGAQFTIKISDFGMSRSLYSSDYYRIEGRAVLPIRWMAWESILLGKFSSRSDVWSFGVTLWEVLMFAREQPFDGMTDEQVIENCGHYYRNDGLELYLPQPSNCPKEIYDLMRECWNREEVQRPSFREISMFLQRKNMGYNPRDEKGGQSGGLPIA